MKPNFGLVPDLKAAGPGGRIVLDRDLFDFCGGRAPVQQIDQLLDRPFPAFEMRLDAAVRLISDPAGDIEISCLLGRPGAKENALHSATNPNAERDPRHQTTLISGASSAFMPTTL